MNAMFKEPPSNNVISKEEFEIRIEKVFQLLWDTLSKSFGPYGAPTIIYNYPYSHVTKDGYTIMKNTSMNTKEQLVDQAISDMAADICGRLNYAVGDGTTTAVIATNSIYQNYRKQKSILEERKILPRDIITRFNEIKEELMEELERKAESIQSIDPDTLARNIYKIAYISNNGDDYISTLIADLYKELNCPAINCELAPDGITKARLINGYKFEMVLNDKLYINNDDNTMYLENADIVIFSIKINTNIYNKILKPLNEECRRRGRHLIVCAPTYDEIALNRVIIRELNSEYRSTRDVNMVLCSYKAFNVHHRRLVDDFSMLCNTLILDRAVVESVMKELDDGRAIYEVFSMDQERKLKQTTCLAFKDGAPCVYNYGESFEKLKNGKTPEFSVDFPEPIRDAIQLGYIEDISLGLKNSIIREFFYDENRYKACLLDAKTILDETENKYKKLGTFNIEVNMVRQRYFSLSLKMGIIEVGADSELSQKLLKDAVDDSIRATSSAFDHGVIRGCNVTLLNTIMNMIDRETSYIETSEEVDERYTVRIHQEKLTLLNIIFEGFLDVYRTVLGNAFPDKELANGCNSLSDILVSTEEELETFLDCDWYEIFKNNDTLHETMDIIFKKYGTIRLHDVIIYYSILSDTVFDVTKKQFTRNVVNSVQTDEEVMKATIDLIGLLITGNQMVVTQKHNFE